MTLLYFAWVRQKLGKAEETLALPPHVGNVTALMAYLATLSDGYAQVFGAPQRLRVAVNQAHAGFDAAVSNDDEVAFFPPVTGG